MVPGTAFLQREQSTTSVQPPIESSSPLKLVYKRLRCSVPTTPTVDLKSPCSFLEKISHGKDPSPSPASPIAEQYQSTPDVSPTPTEIDDLSNQSGKKRKSHPGLVIRQDADDADADVTKQKKSKKLPKGKGKVILLENSASDAPVNEKVNDPCGPSEKVVHRKYSVDADQSTKRPDVYKQKKNFKSLKCRTSPKSLFYAIADFSDEQKQAVRDIGFGSMLDLHIHILPRNLTYYVLDSFNVEKLCIQVDDRRKEIPVSAKDVKTYLGFPKGSIPVRLPHKPENSKLENEFKSQFRVTKPDKKRVSGNQGLITPKHVFNHIKTNKSGDAMFKRNFMILLYNTMLESKKHGNLIITILDVLADVDRIKDFDWCQLVFDLGIQHKKTWADAPGKIYCGPLLFLMMVYIDRVIATSMKPPRLIPIITGWTSVMLFDRERDEILKEKFGEGNVIGPPDEEPEPSSSFKDASMGNSDHLMSQSPSLMGDVGERILPELISNQYQVVRQIVSLICTFCKNIEVASHENVGDNFFKEVNKECCRVLKIKYPSQNKDESVQPDVQDPRLIQLSEEIDRAIAAEMKFCQPSTSSNVEECDTDSNEMATDHTYGPQNLKDDVEMASVGLFQLSTFSMKFLLILDLNGLLIHRVHKDKAPVSCQPDFFVGNYKVYKRPFYKQFLECCLDKFEVGIWTSAMQHNIDGVVDNVLGDLKSKILFVWDQSDCSDSGFKCLENSDKPLFFKELKKVWQCPHGPYEEGSFSATNTLLIDDSPCKGLLNPVNTGIYLQSYDPLISNYNDLDPEGQLGSYLKALAEAKDVPSYVASHPFGRLPITETHHQWNEFYSVVLQKFKAMNR